MTFEICTAVEANAHGDRDHHCIGDRGHSGDHWCLLGHTWAAASGDDAA